METREKNQPNLDFEVEFLEKLVQNDPDYIDALFLLGELYTKKEQFQKALEIDIHLTNLRPDDPLVFYNLACDYSLLNKKTRGLKALKDAFQRGYNDIDYLLKDPDLKNLRESKRFGQIIENWEKRKFSTKNQTLKNPNETK